MASVQPWFRMYNEVVDDPKVQRLPPALFRAWVNLLCLASKNNGTLPDLADVAYRLRLPEPKAQSLIDELIEARLFERSDTGILPHNWGGRQFKSDISTDRVKRFRNVSRNVSVFEPETVDETDQNRAEQNRTEQTPKSPKSTDSVFYPPEFLEFWKIYPRHEGKGAALKAWKKINPSQNLQARIISAVTNQKTCAQWIKEGGQFIPHASTWLNENRWDDDTDSAKSNGSMAARWKEFS